MAKLLFCFLNFTTLLTGCYDKDHYVRIKSESFEVAKKSFYSSNSPTITLLGAVHIGDEGYYQSLQHHLDNADIVLFESIGTDKELKQIKKEVKKRCPKHMKKFDDKGYCYEDLAKLLGLKPQMELVNYQRSHFVHADQSLKAYLQKKHGSKTICELLDNEKSIAVGVQGDPLTEFKNMEKKHSGSAKNTLALSLVKIINNNRQNANAHEKEVIFQRNDIAIQRLRETLPTLRPEQELIIFYGASHMEDLEQTILNMGYTPGPSEWLKAFSL